jgi:putative SOS response-associated peptidase YedK
MKPGHDRMPVVLPRDAEFHWLAAAPDTRKELCQPYPKTDFDAYESSTSVNNPATTVRKSWTRLTTNEPASANAARGNWRRRRRGYSWCSQLHRE